MCCKPLFTDTIRYDTIEVFNVDSKAECGQLNLARENFIDDLEPVLN